MAKSKEPIAEKIIVTRSTEYGTDSINVRIHLKGSCGDLGDLYACTYFPNVDSLFGGRRISFANGPGVPEIKYASGDYGVSIFKAEAATKVANSIFKKFEKENDRSCVPMRTFGMFLARLMMVTKLPLLIVQAETKFGFKPKTGEERVFEGAMDASFVREHFERFVPAETARILEAFKAQGATV